MIAGSTEPTTASTPSANTSLELFSASKWLFSIYAVQKLGGIASLSDSEKQSLTMTSGYVNMSPSSCSATNTVASCDSSQDHGLTAAQVGHFYYGSGHLQHLGASSSLLAIAADNDAALKSEMDNYLGSELTYSWKSPELAGGASDSAADYGALLRKIIDPTAPLLMNAALGTSAVCTWSSATCSTANPSTFGQPQSDEQWHYSLGHWVEDDPSVGDGAFSSPGAYGFYPWIDTSKTWYGILARSDSSGNGATGSILCGRQIRKAWLTGVTQ